MPDISFIFDGIGSSLIGAIIGALIGSPIAYKMGQKSVKQRQKAGDRGCGRFFVPPRRRIPARRGTRRGSSIRATS